MSKQWKDIKVRPLEYRLSCRSVHRVQDRILKVVDILTLVLTGRCLNRMTLPTEIQIWRGTRERVGAICLG